MDSDDGITSSDSGDDQPAPDNDDCVSSAITWPDLPVNIPADDDSLDDIIDAISPAGLDVLINDRPSTVDDWIDRVSHRLTVLLLVGSALVAGSKQFFEDPVHCWIPGSVDADYANRFCVTICIFLERDKRRGKGIYVRVRFVNNTITALQ